MESNDIPEIPDSVETTKAPGFPSGHFTGGKKSWVAPCSTVAARFPRGKAVPIFRDLHWGEKVIESNVSTRLVLYTDPFCSHAPFTLRPFLDLRQVSLKMAGRCSLSVLPALNFTCLNRVGK